MDKRMDSYPDVPTLVELGYNIVAPSVIGIVGPKSLPKERVKILHDAFYKGLQDSGFKNSLKQFDLPLVYRNPEDFRKFLTELYESTGKLCQKIEQK
jgi:tripartite-type tricarboxylate transporter receptor subunit TctC